MKITGDDSISTISFEQAKAKRLVNELRSYLGTGAKGGWIPLMNKLKDELPFLLSKGSPGKKLKSSFVGEAGFHTLHDFIERGLGWCVSEWRTFSSAFKYVLEYDYLTELNPDPSEINKVAKKFDEFPDSKEGWYECWAQIDAESKKKRKITVAALIREKEILINELDDVRKNKRKELIKIGRRLHKIFTAIFALKDKHSKYVSLSLWQRLFRNEPDVLEDLNEIEKQVDDLVDDILELLDQPKRVKQRNKKAA